jgi:hypothetical protein
MTTDFKEIEDSALNLDRMDKARLASELLQSIHGEIDSDIEQAWIQEIKRRKESLKSGKASLHPASEVLREARERIR